MPAIIPIPAFTDNCIWLLREGQPAVFAVAQARAGRALADAVAAFAVVREWKNGFR